MTPAKLAAIARRFTPLAGREVARTQPLAGGHINSSWLVEGLMSEPSAAQPPPPARGERWVLQRLNSGVFSDPQATMANALRVIAHLNVRSYPYLLPDFAATAGAAGSGAERWLWEQGSLWRLYPFLAGEPQLAPQPDAARAAATTFGSFAATLSDLPPADLRHTLAGFHDLDTRLSELAAAESTAPRERRHELESVLASIRQHHDLADLPAHADLPRRVVHGDAKVANLLFEGVSAAAAAGKGGAADEAGASTVAAILDLDTLMSGYLLYDFGDLLRSCATGAAEDDADAKFALDDDALAALTRGYLDGLGELPTAAELASLSWAPAYVSCTLAVRFATDYLAGDVYFRVEYDQQNLNRAKAQLRLVEGFLAARQRLERLLA